MTNDIAARALENRLEEFILPQTGRPLGTGGSSFTVDRPGRLIVRVAFPIEQERATLTQAIREHCGALLADWELDLTWSVDAHGARPGLKPVAGVSNILAVASAKGGVGKSTVAVNLALALAREGAAVGILDADIYGPSQPRMLGLIGAHPESRDGKTMEPLSAHGVKAMSIGFLVDEKEPMVWRGPMVTQALTQLLTQTNWGSLDYLVVDMPPGTGDIQLTLAQRVPLSGAIIVTTPQDIALADARKGLEMFQKVNVPVLGIVENMSVHICSECGHRDPIFGEHGGRQLGEDYQLPLLGALPIDRRICEQTDSGEPTVAVDPDGELARSFTQAALRAAGELAANATTTASPFPNITIEDQ